MVNRQAATTAINKLQAAIADDETIQLTDFFPGSEDENGDQHRDGDAAQKSTHKRKLLSDGDDIFGLRSSI